ncbi:MAG: class A beta-lactamase-related serine hydrolase [Bacteroidetes bacterium]|nr:MAG: class A beta-lactamase-related serine hydrolase [Bacteroidota bacterium]
MKMIPRFGVSSALLVLLIIILFPQACVDATSRSHTPKLPSPPAVRNPHLRALVEAYDRYFSAAMQESETPGAAVVIVKDSVIIFQRGYGLKASNKVLDSIGTNTVFRLGSLSKGFAGVLTGMLVDEGKLGWNDRVLRYVPNFSLSSPSQTSQVQLAHVLSHTTGLPYHAYTNLIEANYDLDSIIARFPRLRLHGKPGEIFSYQNAAFSMIGKAMEATTGRTFPELLKTKIFKPAGMKNASADWESIEACRDLALPHRRSGPDSITHRYYNAAPAGGVNASISDMGQWLLVLLGYYPNIISDGTLAKVFEPVVQTTRERQRFRGVEGTKKAYYGMGWRILVNGQDTIVYHGGSVNDFRSEIAFNRHDGIGICVLFNSVTPMATSSIASFFEQYYQQREAILEWSDRMVD